MSSKNDTRLSVIWVRPAILRAICLNSILDEISSKIRCRWMSERLVKSTKQGYSVATLPSLARALPFDPTPAVSWAVGMSN